MVVDMDDKVEKQGLALIEKLKKEHFQRKPKLPLLSLSKGQILVNEKLIKDMQKHVTIPVTEK